MIRKIIKIDRAACNGCGRCVNACHEGAISLVDGKAALTKENHCDGLGDCLPACPTGAITFEEREAPAYDEAAVEESKGKKRQWPVQIKLMPVTAPWLQNADLLIAADCTAYVYRNFYPEFIQGRVTLVGCPKLDSIDYSQKLADILTNNMIKSITLSRMLVPCCGGMEMAVKKAIAQSGRKIPLRIVTVSPEGIIVNERTV